MILASAMFSLLLTPVQTLSDNWTVEEDPAKSILSDCAPGYLEGDLIAWVCDDGVVWAYNTESMTITSTEGVTCDIDPFENLIEDCRE